MSKIRYSVQARLILGVFGIIIAALCTAMISLLAGMAKDWYVPQIAAAVIIALAPFLMVWAGDIED